MKKGEITSVTRKIAFERMQINDTMFNVAVSNGLDILQAQKKLQKHLKIAEKQDNLKRRF